MKATSATPLTRLPRLGLVWLEGSVSTTVVRTPLASILGSATTLRNYRARLDEAAQSQLIATIQEESERLDQFITDLLDMTRLEAGTIQPRSQAVRSACSTVGSAPPTATTGTAAFTLSASW